MGLRRLRHTSRKAKSTMPHAPATKTGMIARISAGRLRTSGRPVAEDPLPAELRREVLTPGRQNYDCVTCYLD